MPNPRGVPRDIRNPVCCDHPTSPPASDGLPVGLKTAHGSSWGRWDDQNKEGEEKEGSKVAHCGLPTLKFRGVWNLGPLLSRKELRNSILLWISSIEFLNSFLDNK